MTKFLPLLVAAAAAGIFSFSVAQADHLDPDGAQDVAEAAFEELLPDWNVTGECNTAITPAPADVCYRFTPGRSTAAYSIYGAFAHMVTDTGWWVGVTEVEGAWESYGGGRCDLFYCRLATPDDEVLFGFPAGNANCDSKVDSRDALWVLQFVAGLIGQGDDRRCLPNADVFPRGGLDSRDALAILQSDAGLIGALPAIEPHLLQAQ